MAQPLYEIQHIKNSIEEKIKYHFLWKNIQKPTIDEDKLFILSKLVPNNSTLSSKERDVYITTAMLVQIALDTHELVTENKRDETTEETLGNQLLVLAGDYYSGLYYYLLADINNVTFIHKLAAAIKAINEFKMQLHYGEYEDFTEYIKLKVQINYLLFEAVAEYFDNQSFVESFKQWTYITVLMTEKDPILKDEIKLNSMLDSNSVHIHVTNEDKFDSIIHREWIVFQNGLHQLPHSASEFDEYFKRKIINKSDRNTSSVEEG